MSEEEIIALAREYAEEIYPHEDGEDLGQMSFLRNNAIKHISSTLKMLLRRYCLVEKSKVREAYKDAQKDQHNSEGDFALTLAGRNRSAVLIDLFPEIAKEVEDEFGL